MRENPFQSPQTVELAELPRANASKYALAIAHDFNRLQAAWAVIFFSGFFALMLDMGSFDILGMLLYMLMLIGYAAGAIFTYRLAKTLSHRVVAILFCVLAMVPGVNLLAVVALTTWATHQLRRHGGRVGLRGATVG